jgi:hypothetical protein
MVGGIAFFAVLAFVVMALARLGMRYEKTWETRTARQAEELVTENAPLQGDERREAVETVKGAIQARLKSVGLQDGNKAVLVRLPFDGEWADFLATLKEMCNGKPGSVA